LLKPARVLSIAAYRRKAFRCTWGGSRTMPSALKKTPSLGLTSAGSASYLARAPSQMVAAAMGLLRS